MEFLDAMLYDMAMVYEHLLCLCVLVCGMLLDQMSGWMSNLLQLKGHGSKKIRLGHPGTTRCSNVE